MENIHSIQAERQRRRKKRRIYHILTMALALCLLALFIFSAIKLISTLTASSNEKAAFDSLAQLVNAATTDENSDIADQTENATATLERIPPEIDTVPPETQSKYFPLYEQNEDFAGWVAIAGTSIDYPVMLTPTDPEYYLHRAFDRTDSQSGTPFIGAGCTLENNNIIIYGHNMKNGTMFSDLSKYEDEDYWREHQEIHFDTLKEEAVYEIIAVFHSKQYNTGDIGVFRYYDYGGTLDEETFGEYIAKIKSVSLFDTGIPAVYGDQLITLSTCSYHTQNGRIVVVAKKQP